jgi:hypothetical protein
LVHVSVLAPGRTLGIHRSRNIKHLIHVVVELFCSPAFGSFHHHVQRAAGHARSKETPFPERPKRRYASSNSFPWSKPAA